MACRKSSFLTTGTSCNLMWANALIDITCTAVATGHYIYKMRHAVLQQIIQICPTNI